MTRANLRWAALGAGFVVILLYLTLISTPSPPPAGLAHDAAGAERACVAAVRQHLEGAHFPFAANVGYLGDGRYRLHGLVDARQGRESVRRNYECVIRYSGSGIYHADSLRVWQSH